MFCGMINGFFDYKIFAMFTATTKNFHLPLPATLYASLREAAARAGTPATGLAREAIENWLKEDQRRLQRAELADFVDANAGTAWDVDAEWEQSGVASMNKLAPWDTPTTNAAKNKRGKNHVVVQPPKPADKHSTVRAPKRNKAVA